MDNNNDNPIKDRRSSGMIPTGSDMLDIVNEMNKGNGGHPHAQGGHPKNVGKPVGGHPGKMTFDMEPIESIILFMRAAHKMFSVAEKYFGKFNISKGKFNVLMILFKDFNISKAKGEIDGMPLSEVAKSLFVTKSTITGLIDGLEKDGYVIRDNSGQKDKRRVAVRLTKEGHAFLHKVMPEHFKALSFFLRNFNEEENKLLKELMKKLLGSIDEI